MEVQHGRLVTKGLGGRERTLAFKYKVIARQDREVLMLWRTAKELELGTRSVMYISDR